MEYLIPVMYSGNKIHKTKEIPHKCYFKAGDADISKNKEYSNFLHIYFDANNFRDIDDRCSVKSTVHIFNGNLIDWCANKQSETSRIYSNS